MEQTGYQAVKIDGRKHDVHRVLVEQQLGRRLRRNEVVHHKDGNKRNNDIENLEVQTVSRHSRKHGREIRPSAILTPDDVRTIRRMFKETGLSNAAIGKRFGVKKETIRDIRARRTWQWIR